MVPRYFLSKVRGGDDRFSCMFAELYPGKVGPALEACRSLLASSYEAFVTLQDDMFLVGWFKHCEEIESRLTEARLAGSRSDWVIVDNFNPRTLTKEGGFYMANLQFFRSGLRFQSSHLSQVFTSEHLPYRRLGLKPIEKRRGE